MNGDKRVAGQGLWRLSGAVLSAFLLPALLAGCVNLGGGKPPARLLTLSAEATAPAGASIVGVTVAGGSPPPAAATPITGTVLPHGAGTNSLLVFTPATPRELASPRVPVAEGGQAIAYLKGATWVERPARLFRALLAETIRARGQHLVLEDDQAEAAAATHLSGRLEVMGYDAASHSVVVRYDALRSGPDGTLLGRRFEAREANVPPEAAAVAPALNRAANDVARQVADWLG